jgi:hypothetical protein
MKYAVFSFAFLLAGQAIAGGVSVSVENFTQERRVAKAILKVTNDLGKPANNVFVDCAFLNKEKRAVDVSSALIEKISTNDYAGHSVHRVSRGQIRLEPAIFFRLHPLPQIVSFSARHLVFATAVGANVTVYCGQELPHRHFVDLLRSEAHCGANAVDRSNADLAVR